MKRMVIRQEFVRSAYNNSGSLRLRDDETIVSATPKFAIDDAGQQLGWLVVIARPQNASDRVRETPTH